MSTLSPAELKAMFPNATASLIAVNGPTPDWPLAITERKPNTAERRREVKELHRPFAQWLGLNEIPHITCRTDKPSGIAVGWPDFTMLRGGRGVCVEFKWAGETLSAVQAEMHLQLKLMGVPVITATSVEQAIQFVRAELLTDRTNRPGESVREL